MKQKQQQNNHEKSMIFKVFRGLFFFFDNIDKIDRPLTQLAKRKRGPKLTESEINRGIFNRYQRNPEYTKEKSYTPLRQKPKRNG